MKIGVGIDGQGVVGEHLRQPRRFLDRQRVQEDRIDNGENRGVRPDPQAERKNCDEGESRALDEVAYPSAKVLPEVFKHSRLPAQK